MVPARRSPRPAPALAVGGVLAVLVLAACASPTEGGGTTDDVRTSNPDASQEPSDGPTWETPGEGGDDGADQDENGVPRLAPDAAGMPLEAGARGRGLPPGVDGPVDGGTGAAWSAEPGLLYVVTYGSSGCPTVAEPDASVRDGEVVVTFVDIPPDVACTMDFVPATSVVEVPDEVDASTEVRVVLGDQGTVVVPPAVEGRTGPVAWVGLE
ncbi:hypothetical protein [Cellulosimicrobium sp. NPDC057127]|uniref:hypothetical protein n=1 Tax=Cellulosimicrobium sp. NPDC057127 TaxID=3346026 RepID=UPI00363156A6